MSYRLLTKHGWAEWIGRCVGCARKGSKHRRKALTDFVQDKDQPLALALSSTDLLFHKPAFRISGVKYEKDAYDTRLVDHFVQCADVVVLSIHRAR